MMKNHKTKRIIRFHHEDGLTLKSPTRERDMPAMQEAGDGASSSNQLFYVYPFDFWEILGSYIRPEEVGTFARLCHATYAVVNRPNFWLALYRDVLLIIYAQQLGDNSLE